ncbi:unnamed protein product [Prorocentrum cordatum]|uniref:Cellulase n=1 Tax=Prorocentrum cordatum TaxID=2364126 RepID=A0ABN9RQ18_9DINO|nr:unnamed protein product [Polarella glacialis]
MSGLANAIGCEGKGGELEFGWMKGEMQGGAKKGEGEAYGVEGEGEQLGEIPASPRSYAHSSLCNSGSDQYANFGYSGARVCCACGGGTGLTATNTSQTNTFTTTFTSTTTATSESNTSTLTSTSETSTTTLTSSSGSPTWTRTTVTVTTGTTTTATQCGDIDPVGEDKWYDSLGPTYDCDWFEANSNKCGAFALAGLNFNMTANEACCACGGGVGYPPTTTQTATTTTGCVDWQPTAQDPWEDEDGNDCVFYARIFSLSGDCDGSAGFGRVASEVCCVGAATARRRLATIFELQLLEASAGPSPKPR